MSEPQTFEERFPLHAKMKERRAEHEVLLDFFDWAQNTNALVLTDRDVEEMFADYFEVDAKAFEAEKEDMLRMISESGLGSGGLID